MKDISYEAPRYAVSPVSPTSSLLVPNMLLNPLFSVTLNLCSLLSLRDQVLHPYETTNCKIIILYTLILKFLQRRRENVSYFKNFQNVSWYETLRSHRAA